MMSRVVAVTIHREVDGLETYLGGERDGTQAL